MELKIQVVNNSGYPLPAYATTGSAGLDLRACVTEDVILHPMERKLVSTGLKIALPIGYEIQIRPRSGLALNQGITVLNSPGTIDSDYRNNIGVILINLSNENFVIRPGDRIAQMVIAKHEHAEWDNVEELDITTRGESGFGSTGTH